MKKPIFLLLLLLGTLASSAQTYNTLWKRVNDAAEKDLPQTQLKWLDKITHKAKADADFGQLLKAQLMRASVQTTVSPDSADVEIARLEQQEKNAHSVPLKAVYQSVLGKIYQLRAYGDKAMEEKSREWYRKSLERPDLLAQQKCRDYEPAVTGGIDSDIFYGDLLHVLGFEAADYKTLYDYYSSHGNRAAACITALQLLRNSCTKDVAYCRKSKYLQHVDSLITVYGDLREAGELAIEHYQCISQANDFTAEQRYNFINYALSRWGAWPRMNILRNAQSELQRPTFNINIGDMMLLPDKPRMLRVNQVRNIGQLDLNVYRLNVNGDTKLDPNNPQDYARLQQLIFPGTVQTISRRYIGQPVWKENTDSITLEGLPVGVYLLEATTDLNDIKPQRAMLRVSNLYVFHQSLPDNQDRIVVVNATDGKPVAGAHVRLTLTSRYDNEADSHVNLVTDKNGEATYRQQQNRNACIYVYTDEDKACGEFNYWGQFYYNGSRSNDKDNIISRLNLFTDRSIYRPGQTVHAALIAFRQNLGQLTAEPFAGKKVKLTLRDANNKEVESREVITDSYGTAAADFTLPQSGLTGRFTIVTNEAATWFNVEQYRRPTFQAEIEKYKQSYQNGDTIRLQGKAATFSGVAVQGAKVHYTVTRSSSYWIYRLPSDNATEVLSDSVTTDDQGRFTLSVPMLFPDDADPSRPLSYRFDIRAQVTDAAGESQECYTSLMLGNRSTVFRTDLPDKALRDSLTTMTFRRTNLNGEQIEGSVRYRFDAEEWQQAPANKPVNIARKWTSGRHLLEAVCGQDTLKKEVIVFSLSDKKPAVETHDWFYLSANEFSTNDQPVYLQIGSSDKDVNIFYTVMAEDQVIGRGHHTLSNEVETHKIEYKSKYGNGIVIALAWVRNGHLYQHEIRLKRPTPDNRLLLTWKTFRDRLTPGQKETWTLNIATPKGKPAQAQLLAAMYDKSLDKILKHKWRFGYQWYLPLPSIAWRGGSNAALGLYGFQDYRSLTERELQIAHFDPSLFDGLAYTSTRMLGNGILRPQVMMMDAAVPTRAMAKSNGGIRIRGANVMEKQAGAAEESAAVGIADTKDSQPDNTSASLRENLEECAFFYPQLLSEEDGSADIRFTLPQSVTTWHFMALAHDQQMRYGMLESDAVAQKTVMVTPNLPRFIRQGDQSVVMLRIANTSEKRINGTARLTFIDPTTDKTVLEMSQPFSADKGTTANVRLEVDAKKLNGLSDETCLYIVRATAEGRGFSDGEQHWLPLLPDRERVTVTRPITQHEAGTVKIDLKQLFPVSDKSNRLTVEYANTPAWLMVQALPSVATPNEKNAISLATAIYANTIGAQILTSSPRIAQTLKAWQQETGTQTSLTSELQKNEELKDLVLSETPWIADADNETDNRRHLVDFLNSSNIDYRNTTCTQKLQALQNPDGSFSWWPGMSGSPYITSSVATTLARLQTLGGHLNATLTNMLSKAMSYLDRRMSEEVVRLKKAEREGARQLHPSELACQYLYTAALTNRKASADINYLVDLLDKLPTALTIYGKANSAIILSHYGKQQTASRYLQSLREYTVYREETGRYFDTQKALYSWFDYRIPTQVAAIEALRKLTPSDKITVEQMQRWLLQEKRTQSWDTPVNTVNAVYAFLSDNNGKADMSLLAQDQQARISIDGKALQLPASAGMGYVKTSMQQDGASTLTIDKTSQGTSWGAVYAQFWQPSSEVKTTTSGIGVSRQIFDPKTGKAININKTGLTTGQKVRVRITLTADRDYDFVQVQDKRAACLEPASQVSGYRWGYYLAPQDNVTNYYFDRLPKGKTIVETDYYIDREGTFQSGICTAQCAYSPAFSGNEAAYTLRVSK